MSDEQLQHAGKRLDDADFTGAHLHGPSFEGARITDGFFSGAIISGYINGLVVNEVEVAPLVEAELDRRFPQRVKLRATDPAGVAEGWHVVDEAWRATVARARELPEPTLHERVDGEWSFIETLRHLIMATDAWLSRMVHHEPQPFHPWGLAGSFLKDPASLGLDYAADPTLDEVLAVRRTRTDAVAETVASLSAAELDRLCIPPDPPTHPYEPCTVLHCLHVILDEEWEHNRYANRDLDVLASARR